jgi:hypothetical protein
MNNANNINNNNTEFYDINDELRWIKYNNLHVIEMKSNGYINISKICNENNKLLNDYTKRRYNH